VKLDNLRPLPIAIVDEGEQNQIADLVVCIVAEKKKNAQADTRKLEGEIDRLVYKLYDLTDHEIAIVEGKA